MHNPDNNLGIGDRDLLSKAFWGTIYGIIALVSFFLPKPNGSEEGFTDVIDAVDLDKRV